MMQRKTYIVAPPTPKKETDMPKAIEKWLAAIRAEEKMGKSTDGGTKMNALRNLLVGKVRIN